MHGLIRGHWQLLALTALLFALWQTPVVLPLKILIVFLHELSHAAALLLTGGTVESLTIVPQEGGEVIGRGGSRFITLSAGYLGSLLIGAALLIVAVRTHLDRVVFAGLGALILAATGLYVRDGFALGFGLITGASMVASAKYLPRDLNDLFLRVIGLASMIYVPYDIFDDTIRRSFLQSDARMLAEEFGGSTLLWGGSWLALSLIVIGLSLRYGLGADSNFRPDQKHDQRT